MKDTQLVLLVDNPTRDLEGMVLTALEAAYSGARSFLVPMYKQKEAIRRIKPDCVLLNYLRTNNARTVEKYKQKGKTEKLTDGVQKKKTVKKEKVKNVKDLPKEVPTS